MKMIFKDMQEKYDLAASLVGKTEETEKPDSKLKYAFQRLSKKIKPVLDNVQEKFNDSATELQAEIAAADGKTMVLAYDEKGNPQFSKENRKKHEKRVKEILAEEVEFESYIYTGDLSKFDEFVVEELRGFFFPEN